ncbi:MAG TPA: GNAT family N-acetyltransferase [Xylella taiwanensis]
MPILIRDVRESELDAVLALNNDAGLAILPLDLSELCRFYKGAEYFRVAERGGNLAGFLVGFGSTSQHSSSNFAWFHKRYENFFYIDRIVVTSRRRGGGVGRALYADVHSYAELRYPYLACEVFLDHGAEAALLFHGSFGFHEVGQNTMTDIGVRASMLMKEMCSYPWIQETYGDKLPNLPWVGRKRHIATPN